MDLSFLFALTYTYFHSFAFHFNLLKCCFCCFFSSYWSSKNRLQTMDVFYWLSLFSSIVFSLNNEWKRWWTFSSNCCCCCWCWMRAQEKIIIGVALSFLTSLVSEGSLWVLVDGIYWNWLFDVHFFCFWCLFCNNFIFGFLLLLLLLNQN